MTKLSAVLKFCGAERISAGCRRDGHAVAHIQPVINILAGLRKENNGESEASISVELNKAMAARRFCAIHDQGARGDIDPVSYGKALESERAVEGTR